MSEPTWLEKHGRAVLGAVLVSLATPFALLSESQIKDAIDRFFSGCLLVLEVRDGEQPGQIEVNGYMSGKAPEAIDLTFRALDPNEKIKDLHFLNGVFLAPSTPYSSLVLHPLSGQRCPGGLCVAPNRYLAPTELMTIRLARPSAQFDYRFTATMLEAQSARSATERLAVFSFADANATDTCRVEPPNAFNVMTRMNKRDRFLAYFLILLAATVLIGIFKRWGDKAE